MISVIGKKDPIITKKFQALSLNEPSHKILTETIFDKDDTAAIVINACGEATIMLNSVFNEPNDTDDCVLSMKLLWSGLFEHVNQAKKIHHINLIFDNLQQMQKIVSTVSFGQFFVFEWEKTKKLIFAHFSFVFRISINRN